MMLNTETYFLLDIFVRQILVEPELNMMEISQHNLLVTFKSVGTDRFQPAKLEC